jgi:hypothetical protein
MPTNFTRGESSARAPGAMRHSATSTPSAEVPLITPATVVAFAKPASLNPNRLQ